MDTAKFIQLLTVAIAQLGELGKSLTELQALILAKPVEPVAPVTPTPTTGELRLTGAKKVDGKLMLEWAGGDGTDIVWSAMGVTGPTSGKVNFPNVQADWKPVQINAKQSGKSYGPFSFDLKTLLTTTTPSVKPAPDPVVTTPVTAPVGVVEDKKPTDVKVPITGDTTDQAFEELSGFTQSPLQQ